MSPQSTPSFISGKKRKAIHGSRMAYIEDGDGDPIVFLHGNPTSSYLWRNVMPHLSGKGRLIAPDLIGMGDSDKLPDSNSESYGFEEHRKHLFALLDELNVSKNVTIVCHDWGSVLGLHWAHTHPSSIKGIAFMEAIVGTMKWSHVDDSFQNLIQAIRSSGGEEMVLQHNVFIEQILPSLIMRTLSEDEMNEYRRPFAVSGESRRPILSWFRAFGDVVQLVTEYATWLSTCNVPKLFVNAEPGLLLTGEARESVRSWPNLTEVTVKGTHFLQEDSPDEIGTAIKDWHRQL